MGVRRRIAPEQGRPAVAAWLAEFEARREEHRSAGIVGDNEANAERVAAGRRDDGSAEAAAAEVLEAADAVVLPRPVLATAVRYALEELSEAAEGNSVEVRVPPFGVAQCIPGPRHTRGTPPNVVEMNAGAWLALATGRLAWEAAVTAGRVSASGIRADLAEALPRLRRITRGT